MIKFNLTPQCNVFLITPVEEDEQSGCKILSNPEAHLLGGRMQEMLTPIE